VPRADEGQPSYEQMDRPTVMRNSRRAAGDGVESSRNKDDIEHLDIPAFLRRQAD
jgi:hypothetical protein